jgi:fructose-bisphosphate aldolase class II
MAARVVPNIWSRTSSWQPLRAILDRAGQTRTAVGHFNASELVAVKGIVSAARDCCVPVIVGASERERAFAGVRQLAALVRSFRDEYDLPLFVNADHTHSLGAAVEAARAGFDAVGFDASALPFEQNVLETRRAVEALKTINPAILVEGEIGDIGSGSRVHTREPELAGILTHPEEARQFVQATGVDLLAPAVGTMHGLTPAMVCGLTKKRLDIRRIRQIRLATGVPLVLHGGSGTEEMDFREAILAGVTIVHINTEIRLALRKGLTEGLQFSEVAPYAMMTPAFEAVRCLVRARLRVFNSPQSAAEVAE